MVTDAVHIRASLRHMPMRVKPASRLNDDDLFDFCALNRDLRIERTADGELVIMSPTGAETGRRNFILLGQFYAWVSRDASGVGFDSSTGFLLPNGAERSPDLAWIRRTRWDALSPEARRKFAPLCPDFVVELRSAADDLTTLVAKMDEYMGCGAALGWLIDADAREVRVFRQGRAMETLAGPRAITGDPELPGLVIELAEVW